MLVEILTLDPQHQMTKYLALMFSVCDGNTNWYLGYRFALLLFSKETVYLNPSQIQTAINNTVLCAMNIKRKSVIDNVIEWIQRYSNIVSDSQERIDSLRLLY